MSQPEPLTDEELAAEYKRLAFFKAYWLPGQIINAPSDLIRISGA